MNTHVHSVTFEVYGRAHPLAMATVTLFARKVFGDSENSWESVKDIVGRLRSETDAFFRIKEVRNVST